MFNNVPRECKREALVVIEGRQQKDLFYDETAESLGMQWKSFSASYIVLQHPL